LQAAFDAAVRTAFNEDMKMLLLALLCSAPLLTAAQAETAVRGFNPRFGTTPANPNEPNYYPPEGPKSRLDVMIDVNAEHWRDRQRCDRDRRPCRPRN
jgi:hypothetical protein